ncbi:hypothetical protein MP228_003964 [Amoeboaphelidium protococcarum]|nr:hypothetical protein MP228_003964 [Amoeboaphelidium protococcarum]
MISVAEQNFILDGIEQGVRQDGRSNQKTRNFTIQNGVLPQCNGSARVLNADGTEILVSIRAELQQSQHVDLLQIKLQNPGITSLNTDKQVTNGAGQFRCAIEFACNSENGVRYAPDDHIAFQYQQAIVSIYSSNSVIDYEKLSVIPGRTRWVLYADVLIQSDIGGGVVDLICIGINAALKDCRIPNIRVEDVDKRADDTTMVDYEVDLDDQSMTLLPLVDLPAVVTFYATPSQRQYIVDPLLDECKVSACHAMCAVHRNGAILSVQMFGHGSLDTLQLTEILQTAPSLAQRYFQQLNQEAN